jgi:hypothetical protein
MNFIVFINVSHSRSGIEKAATPTTYYSTPLDFERMEIIIGSLKTDRK